MKHALILAALMVASVLPASAAHVFYGIVVHVSTTNIKVQNPSNHQTLGFTLLPKFDQVFSGNGKTTFQMKNVKAGRYVGIVYDQKMLGIRHADKIYLLNGRNEHISAQ